MDKLKGFLEYERQAAPAQPAGERIAHWNEFHLPLDDEVLRTQAARCMDCGTPFCHTGTLLAGAASGCPIHNLIPEWNDLVYHGLWRQALERLLITNNFPEFTGRVCPAPCEGACVLGINAAPVTIKEIEYAIAERGFAEGWLKPYQPAVRTGRRVAVVGSGPAGLACADQLNRAGHTVVVFERADRAGGLLMYGIPNMKLDKKVVQRRIDLMSASGITFITSTEVGRGYPAEKLLREFDAIVLCGGARQPRDLSVEGRQLRGIYFAMEFLTEATRSLLETGCADPGPESPLSAHGKDVVVIGGGDTGTDCVATALRQGCRSVVQFEILERPPDVRQPDNPWPEWPRVYRLDYGHEEAVARFGSDPRQYATTAKRFEGDASGNVQAVHTVRVVWKAGASNGGRPTPHESPGTEQVWPAQLVLLAMGFTGPEVSLLDELGIERDARSNVKTPLRSYRTNVNGVFAAGDMRRGQSLVVWAIHEGRAAARECDMYLRGYTDLP
ncbi:MAG: glutamate synthase [Ardenticatenia bacterium]|nr:MAG: glutamate synthase [Ardenticatenia bacterium]